MNLCSCVSFEGVNGGGGNDTIVGSDRGDFLVGGGSDRIMGRGGNDTVLVVNFNGVDTFNGGAGYDTIDFFPTDNRDLLINVAEGFVGDRRPGGQRFRVVLAL